MVAKADPNVVYMGDTPLSIAARHNRERICRILLNFRETNVNHRNDQGIKAFFSSLVDRRFIVRY